MSPLLLCALCSANQEGVNVADMRADGTFVFDHNPNLIDTIGKMTPAVPTPNHSIYYQVADDSAEAKRGREWWKRLPNGRLT